MKHHQLLLCQSEWIFNSLRVAFKMNLLMKFLSTLSLHRIQQEMVRPKPSGPFKLDQDFINEIEKDWVRSELWQIPKPLDVETGFLYSPLKSAEVNGVSYPADRLQRLISTASQHMLASPVVNHTMNYAANTTISMNTLNTPPSSAATQK